MTKISRPLLITVAVALSLLLVFILLFVSPPPLSSTARLPSGGDFTLKSADGPFELQSLRGKIVLIYFGYTYCPDICPSALSSHAAALRQLKPEELAGVAGVFVSVDPERDTPAHLKDYASFFHPQITGVTGSPEEVKKVARQYGVFYARQPADAAGHYSVDHSSETFVVDMEGRLLARLPHSTTPEHIAEAIRRGRR